MQSGAAAVSGLPPAAGPPAAFSRKRVRRPPVSPERRWSTAPAHRFYPRPTGRTVR